MAIGGEIPVVGIAIKVIAWQRAWYGDAKKADRVRPVLTGLYERVAKLEAGQKDYLRTEDFQAVLEDAFARIADQADAGRREAMRSILLKVIESPRDTATNRLFLRLADELPFPALLVGQGLLDEDQLNHKQHGTYEAVLTQLGRAFEDYRRG
jgi:hypothetical protein